MENVDNSILKELMSEDLGAGAGEKGGENNPKSELSFPGQTDTSFIPIDNSFFDVSKGGDDNDNDKGDVGKADLNDKDKKNEGDGDDDSVKEKDNDKNEGDDKTKNNKDGKNNKNVEPPDKLGDILDNPKTGRDMATIRAKAKQYEREIIPNLNKRLQEAEELLKKKEEELIALKKKTEEYDLKREEFIAERTKMEKLIEDYDRRLLLADIKAHPKFEEYVAKPKRESEETIKRLSKEYGFSYQDFIDAINETDADEKRKKLSSIVEMVNNKLDEDAFLSAFKVYQRALNNERILLESPQRTKEELEKEEKLTKQKIKEQYLEAEKNLFNEKLKDDELISSLDEGRIKTIREFAQNLDFDKLGVQDKIVLAYAYQLAGILKDYAINANEKIKELESELNKYKEQVKKYQSSKPKLGGGESNDKNAIDIASLDMDKAIRLALSGKLKE